jgi:hypothetical protein
MKKPFQLGSKIKYQHKIVKIKVKYKQLLEVVLKANINHQGCYRAILVN